MLKRGLWVIAALVVIASLVLGLRHRPQGAPEVLTPQDSLPLGRRLLLDAGVKTTGIEIDPKDSTFIFLLDTNQANQDSLVRWMHRNDTIAIDYTVFHELVKAVGWHHVELAAYVPAYITTRADNTREAGPIRKFSWISIRCDRATSRIIAAKFRDVYDMDGLIDPSHFEEIDRSKAGLRTVPARPFALSRFDPTLAQWLNGSLGSSRKALSKGMDRSGLTLILDTAFPQAWVDSLRVGEGIETIRKALGPESFMLDNAAFYKTPTFYLGIVPDGRILLRPVREVPQARHQDMLHRLLVALRRRESTDTIGFADQTDTLRNGQIEVDGPVGLRVQRFPDRDSIVISIFNNFPGKLVHPDPVRRRVHLNYRNKDGVAERMLLDFANARVSHTNITVVHERSPTGAYTLRSNGLEGSRHRLVLRDEKTGRPDCHLRSGMLNLTWKTDESFEESHWTGKEWSKPRLETIEHLYERCE
jgi:hypothetical protein